MADIIGGDPADGHHLGIAPGVKFYAYKVCSAVATACSGVALLQAVDHALDPDGDGDMADAAKLWNLSLGSDYGQPNDDLSAALDHAARAGVTVVASAGNGGDKPWIVGSPSTGKRVISVAETAAPGAKSFVVAVESPPIVGLPDNEVKVTTVVGFARPLDAVLTADLQRPAVDATGAGYGCTPADFAGFVPGRIALVDRGTCNVSTKYFDAVTAGASGVLVVNNAPGFPPGSRAGPRPNACPSSPPSSSARPTAGCWRRRRRRSR